MATVEEVLAECEFCVNSVEYHGWLCPFDCPHGNLEQFMKVDEAA